MLSALFFAQAAAVGGACAAAWILAKRPSNRAKALGAELGIRPRIRWLPTSPQLVGTVNGIEVEIFGDRELRLPSMRIEIRPPASDAWSIRGVTARRSSLAQPLVLAAGSRPHNTGDARFDGLFAVYGDELRAIAAFAPNARQLVVEILELGWELQIQESALTLTTKSTAEELGGVAEAVRRGAVLAQSAASEARDCRARFERGAIDDPEARARARCLRLLLAHYSGPSAEVVRARALGDTSEEVRLEATLWTAAAGLPCELSDRALPTFEDLLTHPQYAVRLAAVRALGAAGTLASIEKLRACASAPDAGRELRGAVDMAIVGIRARAGGGTPGGLSVAPPEAERGKLTPFSAVGGAAALELATQPEASGQVIQIAPVDPEKPTGSRPAPAAPGKGVENK